MLHSQTMGNTQKQQKIKQKRFFFFLEETLDQAFEAHGPGLPLLNEKSEDTRFAAGSSLADRRPFSLPLFLAGGCSRLGGHWKLSI